MNLNNCDCNIENLLWLNEEDFEKLLESFEKIEEERMGHGVHEKYHEMAEELSSKYI
jgi:hemerythrin-like domain-containing protein